MQTECKLLSCPEKRKRKPLKTVLIETDTSFLVTCQDIFVPNINIVDESNIYDAQIAK